MPLWDWGAWMAQCSGRAWILPTLLQVSSIYHYRLVYQVITWITNFWVYRCFHLLCSNLTRVTRPKPRGKNRPGIRSKCALRLPQPCHSRSMTSINMVHRSSPQEPIFHMCFDVFWGGGDETPYWDCEEHVSMWQKMNGGYVEWLSEALSHEHLLGNISTRPTSGSGRRPRKPSDLTLVPDLTLTA